MRIGNHRGLYIYVKREKQVKLGELRNIGNNKCKGDITVCMDDDDFEKALIGATARKATLCNCGNCKISATDCPNAAQGGVEPGTLCKHWSDF